MLSRQVNERITRVGAETPAGRLLRCYWQPAALVEELDGERAVKAVRLLGQDLVLFRDAQGRFGLVDRDCPHRGADLSFGRLEDGGLRCPFHGWLFDVDGRCLETPAEPMGSSLHQRIRQRSYPVVARSGVLFAWLGEGEPPPFPAFDCFEAPDAHTFAFKGLWSCNWLQALEVGIDPAHASFLHRFFEDESPEAAYGRQFRAASAGTDIPMTQVLRDYFRPDIQVEATDYGMRLRTLRPLPDGRTHVRITNQIFPQAFVIPMSPEMTISQWHVPIDDEHCYWYAIFTSFGEPVDRDTMRAQRLASCTLPDYRPRRGRHNDYGFDPGEQRTRTYTGMGEDINVHDQWAVESQGAIQDRTREHLGSSDKAIIAFRRQLMQAIDAHERGQPVPMVLDARQAAAMTGPATMDGVCPDSDTAQIESFWREVDARRRDGAPWRAEVGA